MPKPEDSARDPMTLDPANALAEAAGFWNAGRPDEAESACRRVLHAVPGQPEALHILALAAQARGQREQALDLTRRALAVMPAFPAAQLTLGRLLFALGRFAQAVPPLAHALGSAAVSEAAVLPLLVEAHSRLGQPQPALAYLDRLLTVTPGVPVLRQRKAYLLRETLRWDEATEVFLGLAADGLADAQVLFDLGTLLNVLGRFTEAADILRRCDAAAPGNLDVRLLLSRVLRRTGEHAAAAECLRGILAAHPDHRDATLALADSLRRLGQFDDSLALFRACATADPDNASLLYECGVTELCRGGGVSAFGDGQRRSADLRARARARLNEGRLLDAVTLLDAAVLCQPGETAAVDEFESAIRLLETAIHGLDDARGQKTQGWVRVMTLKARNRLRRLMADHPAFTGAPLAPAARRDRRRVIDCCPFFNEVDILDIRLHELYPVVDRFIIVESRETHQGKPKDLVFEENRSRFAPYMDKITYLVCDRLDTSTTWEREAYQRDFILHGLQDCADDDLILVSDVDEVFRAETIARLAETGSTTIRSLSFDHRVYFLNSRGSRHWLGPVAMPYRALRYLTPTQIRSLAHFEEPGFDFVMNGGWHLSWLGGYDAVKTKLAAYAHKEIALKYSDMKNLEEDFKSLRHPHAEAQGYSRELKLVADLDYPSLVRRDLERYRSMGWLRQP